MINLPDEIPKTVLDYLTKANKTILNDYKTSDEHCWLIAIDIAKLFIASGKEPYIMKIFEEFYENGFIHSKNLKPLVYKDQVTWWYHEVCCYRNDVFDPIIGNPVKINEYTQIIFGESINMEILIPKNQIREFVEK